jgi:hypothetical protein
MCKKGRIAADFIEDLKNSIVRFQKTEHTQEEWLKMLGDWYNQIGAIQRVIEGKSIFVGNPRLRKSIISEGE